MQVEPLDAALGAWVAGVDLADPASLDGAALRRAWLRHGVLFFRGQSLTASALAAFAGRFGRLEPPPASETATRAELAGQPVWYISNVVENGRPIGSLGAGEAEWHSDMSYLERPPAASVLYAQEVPAVGGDTGFACMEAAWRQLGDDLRRAVGGRRLHHDAATTSTGEARREAAPGASHPLLRTHPETGRLSLYPGRRRGAAIEGLTAAESDRLLDRLWAHCRDPAFSCTHRWRAGDVAMWDNRRTLHRRDAFDPASRRIMLRAQIAGDRPF